SLLLAFHVCRIVELSYIYQRTELFQQACIDSRYIATRGFLTEALSRTTRKVSQRSFDYYTPTLSDGKLGAEKG
ncbi:hypothetical protein N7523_009113, partial [Penicillium sp. IBT 18751x]